MSDLIRYEEDPPPATAISKTDVQPIDRRDSPTIWRQFCDAMRQVIGRKPLYLALRFAEAKARKEEAEARRVEADAATVEVENQIKLLKAKQEFEAVQFELRRRDEQAKEEKLDGQVRRRMSKAKARLHEAAARQAERLKLTPEEALDEVRRIVDKIRDAGGDVEIPGLDFDATEPEDPPEPTGEE